MSLLYSNNRNLSEIFFIRYESCSFTESFKLQVQTSDIKRRIYKETRIKKPKITTTKKKKIQYMNVIL